MKEAEQLPVLAVGAHPDDIELMCAGTLSLLRDAGCQIHIATMTLGDCGSSGHPPEEISRIRRTEAEAAAELLAAEFHWVGFRDFCIFNDDRSNRALTGLFRKIRPGIVFTHPPKDYISDHEATSRLVRNACFYAPVPNYRAGGHASAKVPWLFYAAPLEGIDIFGNPVESHFWIDVDDRIDFKKRMLACHESQRDWLKKHHGMDEYLDSMVRWARLQGSRASAKAKREIEHAEGFLQHRGHAYPRDNILSSLLTGRVVAGDGRP